MAKQLFNVGDKIEFQTMRGEVKIFEKVITNVYPRFKGDGLFDAIQDGYTYEMGEEFSFNSSESNSFSRYVYGKGGPYLITKCSPRW